MTPEEWQRIKQVMGEALDQPDTKSRLEFLSAACDGDMALQSEIEAMLAQASDRLDVAADKLAGVSMDDSSAAAGQRLGDYELIRELGRGGMGTIYLARRADEEFEKEVAIKILKRGTDTDEVLRRFRGERQILAQLEHPNIARLIDAGTSSDGLPYFVMEYVDGVPITDFCDGAGLGLRKTIELFAKVCEALHFAHQNLVVHRDLKPGNILITATGEPKLLDFGIAKLLSPSGDFLQTTIQNQQRFTPAYASPEQIRGDLVTTASDIYSLGALLYHLLAHQPPHRFGSAHPSPTELFSVIVEQEPLRASVAASANRQSPIENRKFLEGDLDNILRKALRKDPNQRYSSVTAFADDLRRYLNGHPIRARPATFGYRASKFIARNKIGVAAAVLLAATLIGGIAATVWQARKARRGEARAQRRFQDVRKLANLFIFKYHDGLAALPGSTDLRKQLVQDALGYLNNLARERTEDAGLLREIGSAYKRIGDVQGGALANLNSGSAVTVSNLGDTAGAFDSYSKALVIREQLARRNPGSKDFQFELCEVYANLGQVLINLGKSTEAVDYFRKEIALLEIWLEKERSDKALLAEMRSAHGAVAIPLLDLGQVEPALDALRRCVTIGEALVAREPTNSAFCQALAVGYGDTGRLLMREGKFSEALEYYRRALPIGERLVKENSASPLLRRELAVQHRNVGNALLQSGSTADAIEHFHQAIALFEQLFKDDPNDARTRRSSGYVYRDLGEALAANGNSTEAQKNFETALSIFDSLAAKDPKNTVLISQQALTHLKMSRFFVTSDFPGALSSAERAVQLGEALVTATPKDVTSKKTLAESYAQLGACHALSGSNRSNPSARQKEQWLKARSEFQRSADLWRELSEKGKLNEEDAKKRDQVAAHIAHCDQMLAQD